MKTRLVGRCVLVASLTALAGCGTTTQDRSLSGAGIGASAGAIIGAVTGLSVVEGAVLGALGGGLTGALTKPSQVNMGERTRAAIRAYQRDRQMPVDGQVSQALVSSLASN